jgi:predicted RNase H-like nuclease
MRISSVFTPPARIALNARSYEEARGLCSMSRQSYGLMRKIAEVDQVVTPSSQERIFETHPEVAFAAMYGHPWLDSKKTPSGRAQRLALVTSWLPGSERLARHRERGLHVDDVLDSAAASIVAGKRELGLASRLPPDPPRDSRGLRMEIWY